MERNIDDAAQPSDGGSAAAGTTSELGARTRDANAAPQPNADRKPDAVLLADAAIAADSPARVARRDADAERDAARTPRQRSAPVEPVPDPHEQMLRRQLDEFAAEHAHRIRPHDGAERVGSVVAAAVGTAIVHIGRNEYMSVKLPEGTPPPAVGASVTVDRAGNVRPESPERDTAREIAGHERSL